MALLMEKTMCRIVMCICLLFYLDTDVRIYFDYLKKETKYAADLYDSIKQTQSSEDSSEVIEIRNAIKRSLINTGDSMDMSKVVYDLLFFVFVYITH